MNSCLVILITTIIAIVSLSAVQTVLQMTSQGAPSTAMNISSNITNASALANVTSSSKDIELLSKNGNISELGKNKSELSDREQEHNESKSRPSSDNKEGNKLLPLGPKGCPEGFHKDPIASQCVADSDSKSSPSDSSSFLRSTLPRGTLRVSVNVINDDGGIKQPSDFTIVVTGNNVDANPSTFMGDASGTEVTVNTGWQYLYEVKAGSIPDPLIGYETRYSTNCRGIFLSPETRFCTVTNDDFRWGPSAAPPRPATHPGPTSASCATNHPISRITASGDDGGATPASNVNDNNLATRWSSQGVGEWIRADLGSTKNVCEVDIAWYRGNERVNNFAIATSTDGTTFTNVFSGRSSGTTLNSEKYTFSNTNARYIKVTVNGNSQNDWASITELDIFG